MSNVNVHLKLTHTCWNFVRWNCEINFCQRENGKNMVALRKSEFLSALSQGAIASGFSYVYCTVVHQGAIGSDMLLFTVT